MDKQANKKDKRSKRVYAKTRRYNQRVKNRKQKSKKEFENLNKKEVTKMMVSKKTIELTKLMLNGSKKHVRIAIIMFVFYVGLGFIDGKIYSSMYMVVITATCVMIPIILWCVGVVATGGRIKD